MKNEIKNLDEVVFEERNKNYGAFYLRRSYNKYVASALFFAVLVFSAVIAIPLIAGKNDVIIKKPGGFVDTVVFLPEPMEKDEVIKLPEQKIEERISASCGFQVVREVFAETDEFPDLFKGSDDDLPDYTGGGGDLIIGGEDFPEIIDSPIIEKPFDYVQQMPCFKGGEEAMFKWLSKHLEYPEIAREAGIKGSVVVTFVVEKDGSITDAEILKDIGGGCGDEALRVVKLMPKWREGRQNSVAVRVQFILPIRFVLE